MEFKITKTPKQYGRNGLIKTGAGGGIYSYYSSSSNGGVATITNYLPAYWNVDNNRFDVVDNVAFYSNTALWEFFKRETTQQTTTNENGETVIENINNDTLVLTISPNTIKFGDGSEVITTNHFKIDGNNLITDYNIISRGEITAYGVGNGTSNGGGNSGTSTNITIVDNLTSTSTTDALSANQGRLLNEKISGISTHTHTNKSILDGITSTNITNWNNAHTNNHTHGTNKNCDVYRLFVGNYGGIRSAQTNNDILLFSDENITLNANGKSLYLGGNNTQTVYIPTYFDNGDGTTTAQWNSFNSQQLYMQMPMRIALQSHNNTQPPIITNSKNMCTNLNANYLGGYLADDFVKRNGDTVINGNVKINGTLTVSDEITAFATTLNQSLTSKIKTALANVETAESIDDIKSILITLKNSI